MRRCIAATAAVLTVLCMVFLCSCSKEEQTSPIGGDKIDVFDENGTLIGYKIEHYNSDDLLSREDFYNLDDEYDHYVLYEYDSQGRKSLVTTYLPNGIGDFFYDYHYDEDGNYSRVTYVTMKDGYTDTLYKNGEEHEKYIYDSQGNLLSHQEMQNGKWVETPAPEKETETAFETTGD